jgi:hypothetical protein
MKSKTQTAADKANKRGGRDNAASRSQSNMTPLEIINSVIADECHNGIYREALFSAAKYLYEAGIKPTRLMDAKTGKVTKAGHAIIDAVVKCAWQEELDVASDYCDLTHDTLVVLLSHPDLLAFLIGEAAKEKGQGHVYGEIAKTTGN